jgi:hypothetical protein
MSEQTENYPFFNAQNLSTSQYRERRQDTSPCAPNDSFSHFGATSGHCPDDVRELPKQSHDLPQFHVLPEVPEVEPNFNLFYGEELTRKSASPVERIPTDQPDLWKPFRSFSPYGTATLSKNNFKLSAMNSEHETSDLSSASACRPRAHSAAGKIDAYRLSHHSFSTPMNFTELNYQLTKENEPINSEFLSLCGESTNEFLPDVLDSKLQISSRPSSATGGGNNIMEKENGIILQESNALSSTQSAKLSVHAPAFLPSKVAELSAAEEPDFSGHGNVVHLSSSEAPLLSLSNIKTSPVSSFTHQATDSGYFCASNPVSASSSDSKLQDQSFSSPIPVPGPADDSQFAQSANINLTRRFSDFGPISPSKRDDSAINVPDPSNWGVMGGLQLPEMEEEPSAIRSQDISSFFQKSTEDTDGSLDFEVTRFLALSGLSRQFSTSDIEAFHVLGDINRISTRLLASHGVIFLCFYDLRHAQNGFRRLKLMQDQSSCFHVQYVTRADFQDVRFSIPFKGCLQTLCTS